MGKKKKNWTREPHENPISSRAEIRKEQILNVETNQNHLELQNHPRDTISTPPPKKKQFVFLPVRGSHVIYPLNSAGRGAAQRPPSYKQKLICNLIWEVCSGAQQ